MDGYNSTSMSSISSLVTTANETRSEMMVQSMMADVGNVSVMFGVLIVMNSIFHSGWLINGWNFKTKSGKKFMMLFTSSVIAFVCQFLALPTGYYVHEANDLCAQYWMISVVFNRLQNTSSLLYLLYQPVSLLNERFLRPSLYSIVWILLLIVLTNDITVMTTFGVDQNFEDTSHGCALTTDGVQNETLHVAEAFAIYADPIILTLVFIYPFLYLMIGYWVKISECCRQAYSIRLLLIAWVLLVVFIVLLLFSLTGPTGLVSLMWSYERKYLVRYLVSIINFNKFWQLMILVTFKHPYKRLIRALEDCIISG